MIAFFYWSGVAEYIVFDKVLDFFGSGGGGNIVEVGWGEAGAALFAIFVMGVGNEWIRRRILLGFLFFSVGSDLFLLSPGKSPLFPPESPEFFSFSLIHPPRCLLSSRASQLPSPHPISSLSPPNHPPTLLSEKIQQNGKCFSRIQEGDNMFVNRWNMFFFSVV